MAVLITVCAEEQSLMSNTRHCRLLKKFSSPRRYLCSRLEPGLLGIPCRLAWPWVSSAVAPPGLSMIAASLIDVVQGRDLELSLCLSSFPTRLHSAEAATRQGEEGEAWLVSTISPPPCLRRRLQAQEQQQPLQAWVQLMNGWLSRVYNSNWLSSLRRRASAGTVLRRGDAPSGRSSRAWYLFWRMGLGTCSAASQDTSRFTPRVFLPCLLSEFLR